MEKFGANINRIFLVSVFYPIADFDNIPTFVRRNSMSQANTVLAIANDLPIKTDQTVHSGKVRSVYWLTQDDSSRLIASRGYDVAPDAPLAVMVISDRISAFDCIWHGENGLNGVPGKGAALNAISNYWFDKFKEQDLAESHILEVPHPYVWIVQRAEPIMIEAIARQYITGSMWRSYSKGERDFCGNSLPEGLSRDERLKDLLITPSTKGVITGIEGVPEADDANIERKSIEDNFRAFNFDSLEDLDRYELLLKEGFSLISNHLEEINQIFVDTKFEFGYVKNTMGDRKMIYMDEVGTPDSSRIWDASEYNRGNIVENSKEGFRKFLLDYFDDPDVLLNSDRMSERESLARNSDLPVKALTDVSETYTSIANRIIGGGLGLPDSPRTEIIDVLSSSSFNLIE